jgi:hypothetical protein
MERKPIIPYSRLIGDDGAFDRAKADLAAFVKYFVSEAEKLKGVLSSVDVKDTKGLSEYAKEVENLKAMKLDYEKAMKALIKTEDLYRKVQAESREAELDKVKALTDAEIQLREYREELAKLQKEEKKSPTVNRKTAATITELKLRIKDLTNEYNRNQKEVLETGKLSVKERKLLEAQEKIENKRVDTLQEVRDRMAALRLVVQNTSLTTEEGRKRIEAYNKEIDELTKLLSDNSDEFIKNKINIGNYKESIKEALDEIGIFRTEIPLLDAVMNKLIGTLLATTKATEANTDATRDNTNQLGVVAKVQGFLARIFKRNAVAVAVNTAAVETNTVANVVSTEVTATNTAATTTNTAGTNANTVATVRNTAAVGRLARSFRLLSVALKATGLIAIIVVLASLFSVFRQGRAGVVATEKAMARFAVFAKVTITTLAEFGKGIFSLFGALGSSIGNFFSKIELGWLKLQRLIAKANVFDDTDEEIAKLDAEISKLNKNIQDNSAKNGKSYEEAFTKMGNAIGSFSQRVKDGEAAIKTLDEAIYRAFEIGDQIKKAELDIIRLQKTVRGLEIMSDDDTLSLNTQLRATALLLEKRVQLLQKEANINKLNLELANAKARADLQANATTIGARANAIASIKDEVAFTQALLKLNIDLDERKGQNPLDGDALDASVEALKNYKVALNEIDIVQQENFQKQRMIQRDIFEQNLDLLIDLIDKEKTLSEQQVNDTLLSYDRRLQEFTRFQAKFRENAQKELFEFNKLAVQSAIQLQEQLKQKNLPKAQADLIRAELERLKNFNLEIQFNPDNTFKLLNNGIELSLDQIDKLNTELQNIGLAEIPINRLREFTIETQAWVRDTRDQEKALKSVGLALRQLNEENILSDQQLAEIRQLNLEIRNLQDPDKINPEQYDKALKRIEELEKKKTKITEQAEDDRLRIRLRSLADEQALAEADLLKKLQLKDKQKTALTEEDKKLSEDLLKITEERLSIQNQLEQNAFDRTAETNKERIEKLKEKWEQFKEDLFNIFSQIADKFVEMANKQVAANEEKVNKQEKATDDQRTRAQAGLENTLAFEQQQLAKREAEVERARKKAQRLEKIKALYTSFANYSNDPNNKDGIALQKTLRDFAILEAITASFGDGGLVADKVPTDGRGLTRGRSHNGNFGGIPVLVEGGEGFFSRRAVQNFGEDNFRAFHDMLNKGKFNPNIFREQKDNFIKIMPIPMDNSILVRGLQEVREEIKNKPVSGIKMEELITGFQKITETTKAGNTTKRNIYIIKKPNF